jgi:hypothetical protein
MGDKYYWGCKKCFGDRTYPAADSADARAQLEAHEAKQHEGKCVGEFGVVFDKSNPAVKT